MPLIDHQRSIIVFFIIDLRCTLLSIAHKEKHIFYLVSTTHSNLRVERTERRSTLTSDVVARASMVVHHTKAVSVDKSYIDLVEFTSHFDFVSILSRCVCVAVSIEKRADGKQSIVVTRLNCHVSNSTRATSPDIGQ